MRRAHRRGRSELKVPKYYRIKGEILALIADLAPGSTVPTERELAVRLKTSRTTVRQAIAELVVDGHLEHTQGSGTYVAEPRLMQVRQLTSFSQDLQNQGRRPGSVMLSIDARPADDEVSANLEVAPGTPIHRVESGPPHRSSIGTGIRSTRSSWSWTCRRWCTSAPHATRISTQRVRTTSTPTRRRSCNS